MQDVAAHARVDAVVVHAGEAAQVPLLQPPDVAVGTLHRAAEARCGALGDVHGRLCGGEVGAELDELLAQPGALSGLVEERRAVEDAGDQLAHTGKELELGVPVALRVVVEVHQSDELTARHERHGDRALVAPAAHEVQLGRPEAFVAQIGDRQRRVVEERPLQRRIAAGVEDGVANAGVGAVARAADGAADHAAARPPHVHAVGIGGGQQPLREAQDEALEVVGLRDLPRELDQFAHALVAVRELVDRAPDRDRLCAHARETLEHVGVQGEVAVARVAEFDRPDELAAQYQGGPGERAAAAPLHRQPGAPGQAPVGRLQAGHRRARRVAVRRCPVGGGPGRPEAAGVELASVERDGQPELVAVGEVDVAVRRSREAAQDARGFGRHRVWVLGQQRHEVQPGLQRETQVLPLPAQVAKSPGWAVPSPSSCGRSARTSSAR